MKWNQSWVKQALRYKVGRMVSSIVKINLKKGLIFSTLRTFKTKRLKNLWH